MDEISRAVLPRGILVNEANIYQKVAASALLPSENIFEYWRVYSTLYKKIRDPTARRLENYWWRIWSSQRQLLSGLTIASLYEDISRGGTFEELVALLNRLKATRSSQHDRHLSSQNSPAHISQQHPEERLQTDKSGLSSIVTPQPLQPILKRAQRPSTSGSRPITRFALPPQDISTVDGKDVSSNNQSALSHLDEIPDETAGTSPVASVASRRKPPVPTRSSFTASSSALSRVRRRMPRRPSLQYPLRSEASSRTSRRSAPATGQLGTSVDQGNSLGPNSSAKSADKLTVTKFSTPTLSDKAAGKQPALGGMESNGRQSAAPVEPQERQLELSRRHVPPRERTLSVPDTQASNEANQMAHQQDLCLRDPGPTRALISRASQIDLPTAGRDSRQRHSLSLARSQSHQGMAMSSVRAGELSSRPEPPQGLLSAATASTTHVAAWGTILDMTGAEIVTAPVAIPVLRPMPSVLANPLPLPLATASASVHATAATGSTARQAPFATPMPPGSTANIPMARTRSQLMLILENSHHPGDRDGD